MKVMGMFGKTGLVLCLVTGLGLAQTSAPQTPRSATMRGLASRGYLGVGVVDLTDERVKALKLNDDRGVEVKRVDENSPAAKAGLKEDDIILDVDGKRVDDMEQFQATIGGTQPGTRISLGVWRNGSKHTFSATLVARPEILYGFGPLEPPNAPLPPMPPMPAVPQFGDQFPGLPGNTPRVGFEGEELNSQLAEYFGVKQGVLVRSVTSKTPAERAGLKAGDVVIKVNGTPVVNPREISGLVRSSGKKVISFTIVRNKKEMTLNVEVGLNREPSSERVVL
jgi:serine protease Do